MARLKIILLYFVLPVLLFAAFVLYQVGAQHFGVAMMLTGAVVFIAWAWISTTPKEREASRLADNEQRRRANDDWNTVYSIQQINEHRHHR
ncbi:hypothetical protein [Paraburkholderia phenoliruptrix]|uniref:Transmembrane protein n=2 Tax=Paraburkholderia phenoliruptrix TaxID=252970 RepID=K0DIU7_9BURK|nr:hypothetical protein [Paraburkholderia phenoliruptrix]AFT85991.1 hypothetical protein BUPH_02424 [Paraburkholderia phenoliruptrix BR3459a]CAB4048521.1 hypothetical protein LMG9964_02162 [Paraburkholderia phenoliruptrix]